MDENRQFQAMGGAWGRVLPNLKYLGGMLSAFGSNVAEVSARLKTMTAGWCSMHGFWHSKAPMRMKRLAFVVPVYGVGLVGLESYLFVAGDWKKPDRRALKYLRCLMEGAASKKQAGDEGFARMKKEAIWRTWRLAPFAVEARLRRLRWYQDILARPQENWRCWSLGSDTSRSSRTARRWTMQGSLRRQQGYGRDASSTTWTPSGTSRGLVRAA